ncbi:hypothetical protein WAI453_000233 [Rhynchosporium graminicola]
MKHGGHGLQTNRAPSDTLPPLPFLLTGFSVSPNSILVLFVIRPAADRHHLIERVEAIAASVIANRTQWQ